MDFGALLVGLIVFFGIVFTLFFVITRGTSLLGRPFAQGRGREPGPMEASC